METKGLFQFEVIINVLVHVRDRTRYNLRNRDDSNLYNCKTETFKSSFFPSTTKFWNNLDESIRSIESKSGLKAKLSKAIAPVPLIITVVAEK